jgi:outer membrane receptor protein involved in Fe transport
MRTCLFLFAALSAPAARAQEAAQDNEIVVTGEGLDPSPLLSAYSTVTITRDRTAGSASGRLEEVLGGVAGFQQFRRSDSRAANPSAQGATLRGLGGNATSRTLVLLDAVPVTDPFFGYVPFSALPFERLERVTVVRGGGSGAFGPGGVAGTIDLTSARPGDLPLAEAMVAFNDRGSSEFSASLAPPLGQGFAVASARWDRGNGFWTTPAAQRVPASVRAAYESWSVALRGLAPITPEIELQARTLLFDDHRTLRFRGADSSSSGQDASLRLVGRGAWQFDILGYIQARDFSNVVISSTSFRKTLDQRATPSTGLGGKIELRPPLGDGHPLRFGVDWRQASGETREEAYSAVTGLVTARRRAGGVNANLGSFAEGDLEFGFLRLTASARLDRWTVRNGHYEEASPAGTVTIDNRFPNRSGWDASFRGGALVDLGGALSLRGSSYSGLRQPTLNELYRSFVVFPVTTRANAALANERLRGIEAGFDFKTQELELQLTAFENRVNGAIANVTLGPNLRERQNVDAIRSRGIEAAAKAKFGWFEWDGSLVIVDAKMQGSGAALGLDGKRPAQVPKFAASSTITWRPAEGWMLAASVRHTGAQFEDDLQTDSLPAATTLDAWATVPLGRDVSIFLRGENLTRETIITRNQAGSIDLGSPRTLWAGLRVSLNR